VRVLDLPDLPPKGDVSDWLNGRGRRVRADHPGGAKTRKPWAPELPVSRFGAIRWADIDTVEVRTDFLVEDLMFWATSACSTAPREREVVPRRPHGPVDRQRRAFLGKKTRKGGVIYQAGEGGKGLLKRLKAYRQENRVMTRTCRSCCSRRASTCSARRRHRPFIERVPGLEGVALRAAGLPSSSTRSRPPLRAPTRTPARTWAGCSAGEAINKATGAALVWVHHKNAAGDRERGHTSLRANIDTAIVEVIKDEDSKVRTLRLAKMKDGEDGLKLGFELHPVEIGSYDDGKPMTSCVVVPAQLGSVRPSKRGRLSKGQHDFLKVLDTAVSQWGGVVPGALWRGGLIEREDPWLWITDKGGEYIC
jgi:hypothetical protein